MYTREQICRTHTHTHHMNTHTHAHAHAHAHTRVRARTRTRTRQLIHTTLSIKNNRFPRVPLCCPRWWLWTAAGPALRTSSGGPLSSHSGRSLACWAVLQSSPLSSICTERTVHIGQPTHLNFSHTVSPSRPHLPNHPPLTTLYLPSFDRGGGREQ